MAGKDQEQTQEEKTDLQFNFGIKDGMVTVDFGKLVKWIGLPPTDAIRFAELMLSTARQALEGKTAATPGG